MEFQNFFQSEGFYFISFFMYLNSYEYIIFIYEVECIIKGVNLQVSIYVVEYRKRNDNPMAVSSLTLVSDQT